MLEIFVISYYINFFFFKKKNIIWILELSLLYIVSAYFNILFSSFTFFSENSLESFLWKLVFFLNNSGFSILFQICLFIFIFLSFYVSQNIYTYIAIFISLYMYIFFIKVDFFKDYLSSQFFLKNLNINLSNGLLLIHPIYVYTSYMYYFILFLIFFFVRKKNIKLMKINLIIFYHCIYRNIFYSSFALLLGGLWAQQETNWGGWWNWDIIEFAAFIVYIYSVYILHLYKYSTVFTISILYKWVYIYLLLYFISRQNIIMSVHSFVTAKSIYDYREIYFYIVFWIFIKILSDFKKSINYVYNTSIFFLKNIFYINIFFIGFFVFVSLSLNKSYYDQVDIQKFVWLILFLYTLVLNKYYFNKYILYIYTYFVQYTAYALLIINFYIVLFFSRIKSFFMFFKFIHLSFFLVILLAYMFSKLEVFFLKSAKKYKHDYFYFSIYYANNHYSFNANYSFFFDKNLIFLKNSDFLYKKYELCSYMYMQNILSFFSFTDHVIFFYKNLKLNQFGSTIFLDLYLLVNLISLIKIKKKLFF